jgi:hypothetical protein
MNQSYHSTKVQMPEGAVSRDAIDGAMIITPAGFQWLLISGVLTPTEYQGVYRTADGRYDAFLRPLQAASEVARGATEEANSISRLR